MTVPPFVTADKRDRHAAPPAPPQTGTCGADGQVAVGITTDELAPRAEGGA